MTPQLLIFGNFYFSKKSLNSFNVKNVGITFNRDSKGNLIFHATIDEYTLFYCAQVIIYALKGIYSFIYYSENEIEEQIRMYHSTGF